MRNPGLVSNLLMVRIIAVILGDILRSPEASPNEEQMKISAAQRKKMIVVFDLDNTIALIDHRRHWLDREQHTELGADQRWEKFFADCDKDVPNVPIIEIAKALYFTAGYQILIFSGRSEEVLLKTSKWLHKHQVPYTELRMRPESDFTPDKELKKRWLAKIPKDDILLVFDDRQKVVDMWRAEGLTCCQVAPGDD